MGIVYDEHWVSYVSAESLNSALETNITLYVHWMEFKFVYLK